MSPPSDGSTSPSPAITRGISPKPSRPKRSGRCEPRLQCSQPEFALRSHERGIKCTFVTRPQVEPPGPVFWDLLEALLDQVSLVPVVEGEAIADECQRALFAKMLFKILKRSLGLGVQ